jgi:hypothetical protein
MVLNKVSDGLERFENAKKKAITPSGYCGISDVVLN